LAFRNITEGYINEDGIDVEHAKKYFTKHKSFNNYPKATFIKDSSLLLKRKCDILIPAARENVITERNAEDISAKLIVEAANGPISYKGNQILNRKKVFVIPDILQMVVVLLLAILNGLKILDILDLVD
jgi:glutamate dehydrogenase (NAD(P)+)